MLAAREGARSGTGVRGSVWVPMLMLNDCSRRECASRQKLRRAIVCLAAVVAGSLASSRDCAAVTFNFTPAPGTSQQAIDGFHAAGQRWSSLLADDVTINIAIDFSPLAGGALGSTGSSQSNYAYADTRAALVADAFSPDDATAT